MELYAANKILRSVKSALYADGYKLPQSAEADGLMLLLDKLDCDKFLSSKLKHSHTATKGTPAYDRAFSYNAFFRALEAFKSNLPDPITTVSLTVLHKSLFGNIDADAGKPRTVEVYTGGNAHTDPKYISGSLKSMLAKMNDIEKSPSIGKEDFAGYLTHYMRELLIMHPFEHGSEFTARIFIMLFCKLKGFSLCYYRSPVSAIKTAENAAFIDDDVTPLYKLFLNCLSYERTVIKPKESSSAPKMRRELNSKAHNSPLKTDGDDEMADIKKKALEQQKSESVQNDDVLKRAIKLQQKITKLNEQLTELMTKSNGSKPKH